MKNITWLSASNPNYFKPALFGKNNSNVFMSGDAIAKSPALYAFLDATERGIQASDIEIVSIGSIHERADKIPKDIGVI